MSHLCFKVYVYTQNVMLRKFFSKTKPSTLMNTKCGTVINTHNNKDFSKGETSCMNVQYRKDHRALEVHKQRE